MTLSMRRSMRERRGAIPHRRCPVCDSPAAPGCQSCNRPGCVRALRSHKIRKAVWRGGEKYVDPKVLDSHGPKVCPRCRGGKWFGTIDGVAWEGCDRCPWAAPIPLQRPRRSRQCAVESCTKERWHSGAHTASQVDQFLAKRLRGEVGE
jgi:hypothetical protein